MNSALPVLPHATFEKLTQTVLDGSPIKLIGILLERLGKWEINNATYYFEIALSQSFRLRDEIPHFREISQFLGDKFPKTPFLLEVNR